ncbi:hypothetical protein SH611_18115 [Geminicoccaceae bacterium 1502E]|nr:hypothetical protein [Geminicoccaceae bacterium 1502E]
MMEPGALLATFGGLLPAGHGADGERGSPRGAGPLLAVTVATTIVFELAGPLLTRLVLVRSAEAGGQGPDDRVQRGPG